MNKKISVFVLCAAVVFAVILWGRSVFLANAENLKSDLAACASNSECASGNCTFSSCCPAGQCGWGTNEYFTRQCVPDGETREDSWARLVCRNGFWKAAADGWGCNVSEWGGCDSGNCQPAGDEFYCRAGEIAPGTAPKCNSGEACAAGMACNSGVCCSAGQCGWGDGINFTRQCVADGDMRSNASARMVCRNGSWKIPLGSWGCDIAGCESGNCQMIAGEYYCTATLPFAASFSNASSGTGVYYSASCTTCGAAGVECGNTGNNCGGTLDCGACASGKACSAGKCVAVESCTANSVSGCKVCKSDGSGWQNDSAKCAAGQSCVEGVCVAISNCVPKTCVSLGYSCGNWNNGCGGTISCNACASGQSCNSQGACVSSASAPQVIIEANGSDSALSVASGSPVALSWASNNATACTATGDWSGTKAVFGTEIVSSLVNQSVFTITCNNAASAASDSIAVNPSVLPIIAMPDNFEIAAGKKATLQATVSGGASSLTYKWVCGGGGLSGSTILNPVYTAPGVSQKTVYSCSLTVRDGNNNSVVGNVEITVKPSVPDPSDSTAAKLEERIAALQAQIALLQKQLAAMGGTVNSCTQITKNLFIGMENDAEVECLQEFLKAQGVFSVQPTGTFGIITKTAVIDFQEKYAAEVLAPLGLTSGTGYVGSYTRSKINLMLAAGN